MIISPIIIKVERKVTEAKIQDNLDILLFKCFEVFVIESMFPIIVAKINRSASRVRLSPALLQSGCSREGSKLSEIGKAKDSTDEALYSQ